MKNLLDNLKTRLPALIEEVVPTQIKPGELQKVMQNLLRERVPVRDLETILETLSDFASRTKDLEVLTEYVRSAMARTICKQYVDDRDRLWCVTLDPALEELISGHLERNRARFHQFDAACDGAADRQADRGQEHGADADRPFGRAYSAARRFASAVRRMTETSLPQLAVLAYNEVVNDVAVEAVGLVGMNG